MTWDYNPIIYRKRTGLVGDEYVEYNNVPHLISNNKVVLQELPDIGHRVFIDGLNETQEENPQVGKFHVDYKVGIITFNSNVDKTTVLVSYFGAGVTYYPASRVYAKVDDFGEVVETLADSISQIEDVSQVVADLAGAINTADELRDDLNNSLSDGNDLKDSLDNSVNNANTINNTLAHPTTGTIKKSNDANTSLDSKINDANSKKQELNNAIATAESEKNELDTLVDDANEIHDSLSHPTSGSIKTANDISQTLNNSIDAANIAESNLQLSTGDANNTKDDLNDRITVAQTTKNELNNSIIDGNDLKGELDAIIFGTDFEQVINDISDLKTDQHDHSNKSILDKFSEVEGALKYDSQDIGSGGSGVELGETSSTAYRGDRGKIAYDHSQTAHAPDDAQKNSDITKAEIEAKLTGNIESHSHPSYGNGDMKKEIYDTDNDGKVDLANHADYAEESENAENANRLGNQLPEYYAKTTDIPDISDKVDSSRVLSDVPANAKFTDTITKINGKTGDISKEDIVALGIPAQNTTYETATISSDGLMSSFDKAKLSQVEENANWYTHPSDPGYKHLPSGGTVGQICVNAGDGVGSWQDSSSGSSGSSGKKTVRFVIGTSTSGWTTDDCDYLCDGDSDQVEINTAISALPDTGGEMLILDGTYNIASPISVGKSYAKIRGNGQSTILKRMFNSSNFSNSPVIKLGLGGQSEVGIVLSNIKIDGNKSAYTNSLNTGVLINTNKCILDDISCDNNLLGVNVYWASTSRISNSRFFNNTDCILVDNSREVDILGNIIECHYNNVGGVAIDVTSGSNICNIYKNTISYYAISSVRASGSNMLTIANNYINGSDQGSNNVILITSCDYAKINDNVCANSTYAITLNTSSYATLNGNNCYGAVYSGIYISGGGKILIANNNCYGSGTGIYLVESHLNNIVGNICFRGEGLAENYNSSQYTILLENSNNNSLSSNKCTGKGIVLGAGTGNAIVPYSHTSTAEPTSNDGEDGDLWFVYTP